MRLTVQRTLNISNQIFFKKSNFKAGHLSLISWLKCNNHNNDIKMIFRSNDCDLSHIFKIILKFDLMISNVYAIKMSLFKKINKSKLLG